MLYFAYSGGILRQSWVTYDYIRHKGQFFAHIGIPVFYQSSFFATSEVCFNLITNLQPVFCPGKKEVLKNIRRFIIPP